MTTPTVTIVGGTGDLGLGLALRLAAAGVDVRIGSRDAGRAADAAGRVAAATGAAPGHGANADAVAGAGLVVLAVPFASQHATLQALKDVLVPGQVVLDATVPLETAIGGRPTRTIELWAGSAAQQARRLLPDGVGLVAGLHTVSAASLADLDHALDEDVLICGDRRAEKELVAGVVEAIPGLRCVDAGRLELARVLEQLTPLMISINIRHKAHAGIRVTGLGARVAAPAA